MMIVFFFRCCNCIRFSVYDTIRPTKLFQTNRLKSFQNQQIHLLSLRVHSTLLSNFEEKKNTIRNKIKDSFYLFFLYLMIIYFYSSTLSLIHLIIRISKVKSIEVSFFYFSKSIFMSLNSP